MASKNERVHEPPSNYAEYLLTSEEERWEIIDGKPYNLAPAPSPEHQRTVSSLQGEFYAFLKGKPCTSYVAPFDVRLMTDEKPDDQIRNIVQPDLVVICDESKIDGKGCNGPPDLIVEVLSLATAKRDRSDKLRLYRLSGVKEYWIVDPSNKTVEVFHWHEHQFADAKVYTWDETIPVGLSDDWIVDLKDVLS